MRSLNIKQSRIGKLDFKAMDKAIEALNSKDVTSFRQSILEPLECLPEVFECALRLSQSSEFIEICVKQGALSEVRNYYLES
jgi:hypothetical protein